MDCTSVRSPWLQRYPPAAASFHPTTSFPQPLSCFGVCLCRRESRYVVISFELDGSTKFSSSITYNPTLGLTLRLYLEPLTGVFPENRDMKNLNALTPTTPVQNGAGPSTSRGH